MPYNMYNFIKFILKQQLREFQGFKIDYFSYRSRLNRICQGRQTSRDVTVCIVDTCTQNE